MKAFPVDVGQLRDLAADRRRAQSKLEDAKYALEIALSKQQEILSAKEIVRKAAQQTQVVLADHISNIVSKALAAVFPEPYTLECRFVERRGVSECDLVLMKDGHEYHPLESVGGGVADVVSFALRVAYLLISNQQLVLVLDEPAKQLSSGLRANFAAMLRMLTADIGIQCILITHAAELVEAGDRVFEVRLVNGRSKVEVINENSNGDAFRNSPF